MNDGFFMIPNEFIKYISKLTPLELRVLLIFKMYAGDNREAFPSADTVAADLGLKDSRDIRRAMATLREKGFLRLAPQQSTGRSCPNRYIVVMTPHMERLRDEENIQEEANTDTESATDTRGEITRVEIPMGKSTRVESTKGGNTTDTRGSSTRDPGGNHPKNPGGFPPPNNTNSNTINKTKEQNQAPTACAGELLPDLAAEENTRTAKMSRLHKSTSQLPMGFQRFWQAWPQHIRKAGRTKCVQHWQRYKLEGIADRVIAGVEAWKCDDMWRKENGQYIPAPLVWLRDERWEAVEAGAATAGQSQAPQIDSETRAWFIRVACGESTQMSPETKAIYDRWLPIFYEERKRRDTARNLGNMTAAT